MEALIVYAAVLVRVKLRKALLRELGDPSSDKCAVVESRLELAPPPADTLDHPKIEISKHWNNLDFSDLTSMEYGRTSPR
jgi:hypothetical protein